MYPNTVSGHIIHWINHCEPTLVSIDLCIPVLIQGFNIAPKSIRGEFAIKSLGIEESVCPISPDNREYGRSHKLLRGC